MCICVCICANNMQILGFGWVGGVRSGGGIPLGGRGGVWGSGDRAHIYIYVYTYVYIRRCVYLYIYIYVCIIYIGVYNIYIHARYIYMRIRIVVIPCLRWQSGTNMVEPTCQNKRLKLDR